MERRVGEVAEAGAAEVARDVPLALGEQLARDARVRVVAAASVVLVHAAYPPGHPALEALPPGARVAAAVAFSLVVAFPVNAFVVLSFLSLAPRLQAGVPLMRLLGGVARRLVPVQIAWALLFLATRAAVTGALPSPRAVVEGVVLGNAAAHLYFIPMLLALTAASPLLDRLASTPSRAIAGTTVLAVAAGALSRLVPEGATWARAVPGYLGLAPFALVGLALARAWGGIAPSPTRLPSVLAVATGGAVTSGIVLAAATLRAGGVPPALSGPAWAANVVLALSVPVLLLCIRGPVSFRFLRVAPYTLGLYLVHPFFVQALRALEARWVAGREVLLVVPNAAVACALGVLAVAGVARTPLRRLVI